MIVGLIIRNIKSYKNQQYIPIAFDSNLSFLIGENGVGKSTILSALNCVLNESDIGKLDINNEIRSQGFDTREPYIVPVFLMKKNKIKKTNPIYLILEIISNITWQIEVDDFNQSQKLLVEKFVEHKDSLLAHYSDNEYFLIPVGVRKFRANEAPKAFMSFLENYNYLEDDIKELIEEDNAPSWLKKYNKSEWMTRVLNQMRECHNYIYIPAEISVDGYSKIEGELLQSLLGEDIHTQISQTISKTDIRTINSHLNKFIHEISELLGDKYHFKKPTQRQTLFTQKHMIAKIIEAYFSERILHRRDNSRDTNIHNLSSGEKRKALMDLAYAFLNSNPKRANVDVVFTIDEPELSLHPSACHAQFEKLREISSINIQTIVTTHWYGYLPVVGEGAATYISPNQGFIRMIKLGDYRNEIKNLVSDTKGSYADTLEIKSNYDIVQSIITSITSGNEYNWVICEGITDKEYLKAYLDRSSIKNLVILPISGMFTLKKVYQHLILALDDRKPSISGKVFFLIDTDERFEVFDISESIANIKIRKVHQDIKGMKINLIKLTDTLASPRTVIEDALDSKLFIKVLLSMKKDGFIDLDFINNDMQYYYEGPSGRCIDCNVHNQNDLDEEFKKPGFKKEFSKRYVKSLTSNHATPSWIEEIASFLSK